MKKIIFYLLFSIFIYQIGGYVISFTIMKHSIKSEMKAKIKKSLNANEYQFFNLKKISKENSFKSSQGLLDIGKVIEIGRNTFSDFDSRIFNMKG